MKPSIIFIAAAALLLTACHRQERASLSDPAVPGTSKTIEALPDTSGHDSTNAPTFQETTADTTENIEDILSQLDWSAKAWDLDEVLSLLDQHQVEYQGTWTVSQERADLQLNDGTRLLFLKTTDSSGHETGTELLMINDRFNDNGFQENYLNQYDVTADEEYYPETATRLLQQEELWKYNQTDLSIARNEIFARHGRKFSDNFLNAVFSRKTWYHPQYTGTEFSTLQDKALNRFEKKNLSLLVQMEQERGFRKKGDGGYEQPVPVVSGSWIDFDLDGKKEKITYEKSENAPYSDEKYELTVGEAHIKGAGDSLHAIPYTASLDGLTTQILIRQDGPSADPMAEVYTYKGGALQNAGIIPGDDIQICQDFIACTAQRDFFQTYQGQIKCRFQGGTISTVEEPFYEQGKEAVASATIPLLAEKNLPDISVTLTAGDQVIILGSDYREWVLIQKKGSSEKGWLKCGGEDSPYLCTLPDGTQEESWNLFDGLTFYG